MSNDLTEIKKLLKSTSIKAFIKYYKKFEKNMDDEKFIEIFKKNEKWEVSSYKTIIKSGKDIFSKSLNEIALVLIISLNKRIDEETKYKAKKYLRKIEENRLKEMNKIENNLLTDEEIYWELKDYEDEKKIIYGK